MAALFEPIPLWKSSGTASSEAATVANPIAGAGNGIGLPDLIAVSDVASVFGRSERTIRRWIANGSLPALTIGRSLFIRSDDVRSLIAEGMSRQATNIRGLMKKYAGPATVTAALPEVYVPPD